MEKHMISRIMKNSGNKAYIKDMDRLDRSGMSDEPATLRALGIKTGGVYGSMLIMR